MKGLILYYVVIIIVSFNLDIVFEVGYNYLDTYDPNYRRSP